MACASAWCTLPSVAHGRRRQATVACTSTPRAGGRSMPKRLRDAPPSQFPGVDPGAVECLVSSGVRPVEQAVSLLQAAVSWAAGQDTSLWSTPQAAAALADTASESYLDAAAWAPNVTFTTCRATLRELLSTGVRKKSLPGMLSTFPGALALPLAELEARLDALVDVGIEEMKLPRVLEKHLSVLQHSVDELHRRGSWLTALGVADLSSIIVLSPRLLTEPLEKLEARVHELSELGQPMQAPALGACVERHPELLLPLTGGSFAERLGFWKQYYQSTADVGRLAAQQPAMLTTSVSVLRRKAAVLTSMLSVPISSCAPEWFGQVNLDRTLQPRLTFLLHRLGSAQDVVARNMGQWVRAEDVEQFLSVCAQLVPDAASRCTLDEWRAHTEAGE